MAAGISVAVAGCSSRTILFKHSPFLGPRPTKLFSPSIQNFDKILRFKRRNNLTVCFVLENEKLDTSRELERSPTTEEIERELSAARLADKLTKKKSERFTYLIAAVMSSFGITSMAVMAVYYRFSWQMEGGEVPYAEMFGTFALSVGAAVGMEFWARWAHRALWHASLWHMDEVIQQQRMPKELLQSSLMPILVNLAHRKNLSMPLLQGLACLFELLSKWFMLP